MKTESPIRQKRAKVEPAWSDDEVEVRREAEQQEVRQNIERLLDRQRASRWSISKSSADERISKIRRLEAWVDSHRDEIRQAGHDDFRKPATEVDLTEIYPVLQESRLLIRKLKSWMRPRRVRKTLAMASTQSRLHYEARGVTLILAPWNYPFNLSVVPLISAIAAGNCAILKPSEMTPAMSRLLCQMVGELFEEHEVAALEGGVDVSQALLTCQFDHIFFTGSPQVGRIVMAAAVPNLTTVTLELGGKSPVIVEASAHIDDAASKIVWGKFINQGQTCIAPDYALVERSIYDTFRAALIHKIEQFYGDSPEARRQSPDLARIVNDRHFQRLESLLNQSVEMGAQIVFGGRMDAEDRWIEPTLIEQAPSNAPVMEEEIFGPILPLIPYNDLQQALDIIRRKEKPLALYAFSNRSKQTRTILEGTSSGGACVNEVALHFLHPGLPFGGVNHSGHGSYHGIHGFKAFSHERAVLTHHRWSALKLLAPPYTDRVKRLVRWIVKYL